MRVFHGFENLPSFRSPAATVDRTTEFIADTGFCSTGFAGRRPLSGEKVSC